MSNKKNEYMILFVFFTLLIIPAQYPLAYSFVNEEFTKKKPSLPFFFSECLD